MTDKQDLIREIQEYVAAHGGENTATHLLVQAAAAISEQAAELEAVGAGGVQPLSPQNPIGISAEQTRAAIKSGAQEVPIVWLSGKQLQGVTGIHGSYLPFRRQREGLFDTPVYLEAAAPQAAPAASEAASTTTATPPPSDTLWRLLTGGYDLQYVNKLDNADREKSTLIERAAINWRQICREIGAEAASQAAPAQEPHHWIVPEFGFLFSSEEAATRYLSNIGSASKPIACYTTPQTRFSAEDMATTAAREFRAGKASCAELRKDAERWRSVEAMVSEVHGGDEFMVIELSARAKPEQHLKTLLVDKVAALAAQKAKP